MATAGNACRSADAVVGDFELELFRGVADPYGRARVAGVLQRVRQRLLHDSIGGELDPERQFASLALHLELDGQPGLADLRHEPRQVGQRRLRRKRLALAVSQHPDEPAHLRQRAPSRALNRLQHVSGRACGAVEGEPFCARLDDDQRHVVSDRVVQFARDPRPLLDHRLPRGKVAFAFREANAPVAIAEHEANEAHDGDGTDGERDAASYPQLDHLVPEVAHDDEREGGDEHAVRRPDGERIERTEPADRQEARGQHESDRDCDGERPLDAEPDSGRPPPSDGDRPRHDTTDERGDHPVRTGAVTEPNLELDADRQHARGEQIDRRGLKARTHGTENVNGLAAAVVSLPTDRRRDEDRSRG